MSRFCLLSGLNFGDFTLPSNIDTIFFTTPEKTKCIGSVEKPSMISNSGRTKRQLIPLTPKLLVSKYACFNVSMCVLLSEAVTSFPYLIRTRSSILRLPGWRHTGQAFVLVEFLKFCVRL